MYKERRRVTQNGIEIFDYKNPTSHGFFISLFLRAGSMNEPTSGITHFLEHVMIRNVSRVMDDSLYPLLDEYGLEFNASTYSEMVQFYVTGAKEKLLLGAELLSKLLSPIIFPSLFKTTTLVEFPFIPLPICENATTIISGFDTSAL